MKNLQILPIEWLHGRKVSAWFGVEMAFGGGIEDLTEGTPEGEKWRSTPPIWRVAEIPFAQFILIDIILCDGSAVRLLSDLDVGNNFYGLYLIKCEDENVESPAHEPGSIYRAVHFPTIPIGEVDVSILRRDESEFVIEAELSVGGARIKLISAEVYERDGIHFDIVEGDESILLQVNGVAPDVQVCEAPNHSL